MPASALNSASLALSYGHAEAGLVEHSGGVTVALANPVLDGPADETWVRLAAGGSRHGSLTLWHGDDGSRWGAASVVVEPGSLAAAAERVYREIFQAQGHLTLQRIWNYIPRINAPCGGHGQDRYQAFCGGRARALQASGRDGAGMPAASAMGTPGDVLTVLFVAGTDPVRHVENPRQLPAHRYPARYGPHPPSFARASLVSRPDGARRLYLSGTASIRGSESLHPGDVVAQLSVALENADLVARAAGLTGGLGAGGPGARRLRLYLRRAEDWPTVRPMLDAHLPRAGDWLSVIEADICRPELLVEIEACVDTA